MFLLFKGALRMSRFILYLLYTLFTFWALPIFQHTGTGCIEIAVFVLRLILVNFGQNFSERSLLDLKSKINRDFNHEFSHDFKHMCNTPLNRYLYILNAVRRPYVRTFVRP